MGGDPLTEATFPPPWYEPTPEDQPAEDPTESVTETVVSLADERNYATCGATRKQLREGETTPGKCTRPAGWGTDHVGSGRCKLHGGSSPAGKKFAQKQQAVKARDTYGLPVDIDPADALLQEVHRTAGHVAWLGAVVAQLRKGDLGWGVTKVKLGGDDYGTTYESKHNIYLGMYNQERKHLVSVTSAAIKAGVEQKRLTLETQRAELIVTMLGDIFDSLDLTPEQATKLEELVPKALTAIAATEASK